ncbi:endoglucanase [Komagataeibacter medellinensis]|uniref:endoglucanase n=1 Tax=Komagataeibacter medellinensis TaxID=1177712 RepID=UPI001E3BBE71|nr:endoglucanase [Komagataeibacter medellinensis]
MTTSNKENVVATPRPTVDMNNPQDVARMLTGGYGLSGEGFHYHSFTRPVMLDVTPDLPSGYEDDTQHHLDDNVTECSSVPTAEPEPVAEPVHTPVAPPVIAEIAPTPPPPPPAPPAPPPHTPVVAPAPHQPEVVVDVPVPEPVVEVAKAQVSVAPEKPQFAPTAQVAPASSADTAATAGHERRGLQPFAASPSTPAAATPPRAAFSDAPTVQADDWAPVPKAQQRRGQRPTGPGFFFAKGNDRVVTARLFQPVAVTRPAPKPATKVTTMTKFDKNAQNNPVGRRPAPSDNSPTLTEVFMTLGGRATDRLVPKPSLRDALLRKREEENGQS